MILNYLVSFRTFVDNVQNMYAPNIKNGNDFVEKIINKMYDTDDVYAFFYKLRNYATHFGAVFNYIKCNIDNGINLKCSKKHLLEYKEWNEKSKAYLNNCSEKKILEVVYEPKLLDNMYGFRPNRGCHNAIKYTHQRISRGRISYIVDADVKGFFDHINHDWMVKFLEYNIKDPNIIWLVKKYLKAGIMDKGK